MPRVLLIAVLGFILIFRTGVVLPPGTELKQRLEALNSSFPFATADAMSTSLLFRLFTWGAGVDSTTKYLILGIVLVATAYIIGVASSLTLPGKQALAFGIVIALSPAAGALLIPFGRYDAFFWLGSVILVLRGRSHWWAAILGTSLMLLSNPEMAAASLFTLALLVNLNTGLARRRIVNSILGGALVYNLLITMLYQGSIGGGRVDDLDRLFSLSMWNFMSNLPLQIYAAFGPLLVFLAIAFIVGNTRLRAGLIIAVVGIPLILTAITLDQTRVFALVSFPAALIIVRDLFEHRLSNLGWISQNLGAVTFLLFLFVPPIVIFADGIISPFAWVLDEGALHLLNRGVCILPECW